MTQELTVALRIKAFLTEARQAIRDFNKDLKDVGVAADQASAKLAKTGAGGAVGESAAALKAKATAAGAAASAVAAVATQDAKAAAAAKAATVAHDAHNQVLRQGAISAGQHAQAMRQLPMQITDIVTSLASGMPVHMVAIQQGGQLRDSFGGIGNTAKALLTVLTPLRLAVGGVAAGVAALVLAYKQGSEEQDAFTRAIAMSGNAAGTTGHDLAGMARNVERVVGTQAAAADALAQLVQTGRVARADLEKFAATAVQMERSTGQAVSETVKNFAELGKAPLEATLKLNEGLRYMTLTLYDQLQALIRSGQEARAAAVAQAAYASAVQQASATVETNLGTLERAWRGVGDAAKKAWDWMLGIGRKDTLQQKLDAVTAKIEKARRPFDPSAFGGNAEERAQLPQLLQEQAALQEQIRLMQRGAEARAEAVETEDAATKARKDNAKWTEAAASKQERLNKLLQDYRRNNERIRAAGGVITPEQVKREEGAIRESVYGKGPGALEAAKAESALQRATIEANLRLLQQAIKDGDAIIEQAVKDGNLSIEAAYAARLSQIATEGEAQRRAYQAEIAEVDKALRQAKNQAERAPLLQQQVELNAKVQLLDASLVESARKLGIWKTEQERALSAISAKIRVDVAGLTGTFDREAVRRQIQESMRGDTEAVGRIADPAEQQAARDRLNLIAAAGLAQAEFNARVAEAQRLQGQLAVTEQSLQVMQQQGAISQVEIEGRLRDARAAQLPALQQILQQMRAIRDAMPPEAAAAIDAMTRGIGELENQAKSATPVVTDLGTRLRNTAIDGLADAAAQAVTNFKNLRSSVGTLLKQIAADIIRSGIKRALVDQFSTSGGGGGGGGGGFLSAIISAGKAIFGFAEGGLIRGPGTNTSDSIPALVNGRRPIAVSDEEYIQPAKAVKHYGLGFMEAVRTLSFPRPGFAFGGLVAAHQRARYATGGLVTAGADAAPSVVVQVMNTGTPQRVVDQRQQFDGRQMVVSVVLDDLSRGGPISQHPVFRGRG
jgi:phage-related minor tail protein